MRFLFLYPDNHDIISMKFYETEMPVMASENEADDDRSRIVPVATGAEPYRGTIIKNLLSSLTSFSVRYKLV